MVNLAAEQINTRGRALGRRIAITELDAKSTAIGSKEDALEAVSLNATAFIGAVWSSHSLAMAAVLQENGIPMITLLSTNPEVAKAGDYVFRFCFTDDFQ